MISGSTISLSGYGHVSLCNRYSQFPSLFHAQPIDHEFGSLGGKIVQNCTELY